REALPALSPAANARREPAPRPGTAFAGDFRCHCSHRSIPECGVVRSPIPGLGPATQEQRESRFPMIKRYAVTAAGLGLIACLALPAPVAAQVTIDRPGNGNQVKVDPFHFGLGALATWSRDAGEPATHGVGDPQRFGLLLQKLTLTANFSASGASLFS